MFPHFKERDNIKIQEVNVNYSNINSIEVKFLDESKFPIFTSKES